MPEWVKMLVTVICSVAASSGFWAVLARKLDKNDAKTKLLIGLAHERIISLGMKYIERGWIYKDEYEDFTTYLYEPYEKAGGNGSAKKIFTEVKRLPIRNLPYTHPKEDIKP